MGKWNEILTIKEMRIDIRSPKFVEKTLEYPKWNPPNPINSPSTDYLQVFVFICPTSMTMVTNIQFLEAEVLF